MCSRLKKLPETKLQELKIPRDAVSGVPEVQCYIEKMNQYLRVRRADLLSKQNKWELCRAKQRDIDTGTENTRAPQQLYFSVLQDEAQKAKYPNNTDFSVPVNSRKMKDLMKYNPQLYNVTLATDVYYRYFEVALGYWLTHGNTSYSTDDYVTYKRLLGGEMDPTDASGKSNFQG